VNGLTEGRWLKLTRHYKLSEKKTVKEIKETLEKILRPEDASSFVHLVDKGK
jgi:plasmid maintenance system antidote protein VapI